MGLTLLLAQGASAQTPPAPAREASSVKPLVLNPISENTTPSGCGCHFYRPTDKRELGPLLLHLDSTGRATARPEGQLVQLAMIDEQHSRRDPKTISARDRVLIKFRGSETSASLIGEVERNCPRNGTGTACASVSYQSLLNVTHKGRRISQPVWGFCGCR